MAIPDFNELLEKAKHRVYFDDDKLKKQAIDEISKLEKIKKNLLSGDENVDALSFMTAVQSLDVIVGKLKIDEK